MDVAVEQVVKGEVAEEAEMKKVIRVEAVEGAETKTEIEEIMKK